MDDTRYDAFICHASEDKKAVAAPLADTLTALGLRIWYDEFSLKIGDSLSASIDRGLRDSRFGIVILSHAFFSKHWPQRELQGLVAKEVGSNPVILPVWHGVQRADVLKFSPTLADKLASSTVDKTIKDIALDLLQVLSPEVSGKYRRLRARELLRSNEIVYVDPLILQKGRYFCERLPMRLLVRIRLLTEALAAVFPTNFEQAVDDFRHDLHVTKEIAVWERIAATYLSLSPRPQQRTTVFGLLLLASFGHTLEEVTKQMNVDAKTARRVFNAYFSLIPPELVAEEEAEDANAVDMAFGEVSHT